MTQKQYELIKLLLSLPFVTPGRLCRQFKKYGVRLSLKDVQIVYLSPNYEKYETFDPLSAFDPEEREILHKLGLTDYARGL